MCGFERWPCCSSWPAPIASVHGLGMMLSAAFGDGRNGIATIVTLSGLFAPLVGIVLIVMGRRDS